jgi:hypothetical protein
MGDVILIISMSFCVLAFAFATYRKSSELKAMQARLAMVSAMEVARVLGTIYFWEVREVNFDPEKESCDLTVFANNCGSVRFSLRYPDVNYEMAKSVRLGAQVRFMFRGYPHPSANLDSPSAHLAMTKVQLSVPRRK